jgi:hypothetical protein
VKKSWVKLIGNMVGGCLLLLLAVNYIVGELSSKTTANDAALAKCQEKGWKSTDVALIESNISNGLLGSHATVVLKPKDRNQPQRIRMTLSRRINFLEWVVVDYNEE